MQQTTAMWPGFELAVEREVQWVESGGNELNPEWKHVDSNAHGHFVSSDKADRLPTLVWIVEPCTMGHGDDCEAEGHYECRTCGEDIRPGSRPARPVQITGPNTYTLTAYDDGVVTTYRFGEEQWQAMQTAIGGIVRDTLEGFVVEVARNGPSRSR